MKHTHIFIEIILQLQIITIMLPLLELIPSTNRYENTFYPCFKMVKRDIVSQFFLLAKHKIISVKGNKRACS